MIIHIYQYNIHAEQRFFLGMRHRDLFDLIALNGNIVSHTPAGVAAFVATAGKDFYINPQTYAFQHPTIKLKRDVSSKEDKKEGKPPKYEFKPSIKRLAQERLGGPFASVIKRDKPITPDDFQTDEGELAMDVINETCEAVIEFQRKILIDSLDEEEKDFIGAEARFEPKFVLAPYFYLTTHRLRDWLNITLACYQCTVDIESELPVYLPLVISKEVLYTHHKEIAEKISQLKPSGILLWIDEHVEERIYDSQIKSFVKLLQELRQSTETIYNSHGGYLSFLLCHSDIGGLLNGVGHSVNYGESRNVVPIGGGIPMARFYYPSIHSRLRFGDALDIIRSGNWLTSVNDYRQNICSCVQCIELINSNKTLDDVFEVYGESYPVEFSRRSGSIVRLEYPTTEAKRSAAYHYLYNKAKELQEIRNKPLKDLLADIKETYELISSVSGDKSVAHLFNWELALQEIIG